MHVCARSLVGVPGCCGKSRDQQKHGCWVLPAASGTEKHLLIWLSAICWRCPNCKQQPFKAPKGKDRRGRAAPERRERSQNHTTSECFHMINGLIELRGQRLVGVCVWWCHSLTGWRVDDDDFRHFALPPKKKKKKTPRSWELRAWTGFPICYGPLLHCPAHSCDHPNFYGSPSNFFFVKKRKKSISPSIS
jgi:hypothetical protein